ncbi:MAG: hypothetical protein HQL12_05785 [Candidatus Omnitrophica bacterium]|nr:hypothetical protein [Candidatus Omnitrophota bacterium]
MAPYTLNNNKAMFRQIRKVISIIILVAFISTSVKSPAYAQVASNAQMPWMPKSGVMVHLSQEFTPSQLTAISIHPDNALQFDFLINKGDQSLAGDQKKEEYKKLVKYFLASLTIPDDDQWVNLSPYEKNRIIQDNFGKTEMGRDLLAQDYLLKQITSSLIYPEEGLGKQFWNRIYQRAWTEYHTTNIPVNTFNKVWIVPDEAMVYESGNTAYILRSHLKVMLEEDYLSLSKHTAITAPQPTQSREVNKIGSQVVREIVLPELEKEVNTGKNFANLRQMYSGMVLATWYKKDLKESLLGKIYADRARVKGIDQNPRNNEAIYQQYLKAFKKGVFNYIKEDVDKYTNETIPRKYFSGGFERGEKVAIETPKDLAMMPTQEREQILETVASSRKADLVTVQVDPTAENILNKTGQGGEIGGQSLFAENLPEKEVSAGQEIITALREGVVVEAQGTGSKVTFNVTPQVRTAVRSLLAIVNPKIQLTAGNLSADELADIQSRLSTAVGSPVTVARDGQSLSFESALSAENARQQIDSAMRASLLHTWGMYIPMFIAYEGLRGEHSTLETVLVCAAFYTIALLYTSAVDKWGKNDNTNTSTEFIKHNVKVVPMANGQEGSTITLPRPKERPVSDGEWNSMMDSLVEAVGVTDSNEYAVKKGDSQLVITTSVTKSDVDSNISDMAMAGIPTVITALREGVVVEAQGTGSKVTFNVTPQVRTAVRSLLAIVNPKIQLTAGNLSADELADIQSRLSTAVGSPVTVARDGQSLSFESALSAENARQQIDSAMRASLLHTWGMYIPMFIAYEGLRGEHSTLETVLVCAAFYTIALLYTSAVDKWGKNDNTNTSTEFIKHNVKVVPMANGQEGSTITLPRPKERPVSDGEWNSMMDSLVEAVGVTDSNEYAVKKGDSQLVITTSVTKSDVDSNISDMAMAGTNQTLSRQRVVSAPKHKAPISEATPLGGIDFNSANLAMTIKRDGKGVPLPLAQQDMAQLNSIGGFTPEILEIRPAVNFPIISELQQKLQSTSVS